MLSYSDLEHASYDASEAEAMFCTPRSQKKWTYSSEYQQGLKSSGSINIDLFSNW